MALAPDSGEPAKQVQGESKAESLQGKCSERQGKGAARQCSGSARRESVKRRSCRGNKAGLPLGRAVVVLF